MYRALIGVGAGTAIFGMIIGVACERWSMRTPYPVGERTDRLDWSSAGSSVVAKPIYIAPLPDTEALPVVQSAPGKRAPARV
jgi:hypothetical protein